MKPQIKQQVNFSNLVEISSNIKEVEFFLIENYLSIVDGMSDVASTLDNYRRYAHPFIHFVQENGLHLNLLNDYKKAIKKAGKGYSVNNTMFVVAKKLLKILHKKYGLLKVDLTYDVKGFGKGNTQHKKEALEWEDVLKIEDYLEALPYQYTYFFKNKEGELKPRIKQTNRDVLLLLHRLFAYQGLREFEATNLLTKNVNFKDKKLRIKGKQRDDFEDVDLHPITLDALAKYIASNKPKTFLFPSKQTDSHITERNVRYMFTHRSKSPSQKTFDEFGNLIDLSLGIFPKLGITHRSVHCYRYFFTTELLKSTGGDLHLVSKLTRHKSIQTVAIYDSRINDKEKVLPVFRETFSR